MPNINLSTKLDQVHSLVRLQQRLNHREGDSPALKGLSLAEVRRLLTTALPQPVVDLPTALDLLASPRQRKAAADRSPRTRILTMLNQRREEHVSLEN